MVCTATKKDGTPCKGEARENGLCIAHIKTAEPVAQAKLKGMRRARNPRIGLRGITMLRPICQNGISDPVKHPGRGTCQSGAEVAWNWYEDCPHDPYVGVRQNRFEVPIYSEPHEDGSRTIMEMEERVTWEPFPNFAEAVVDRRVNSGRGVERARRKGWILPEELRSPAYPNGIAPMCQFRSCRWQDGLVNYRNGTYCREMEARLVGSRETNEDGNLVYGALPINDMRQRDAFLQKVMV